MLPVVLVLLLIAILFGMGIAIHVLWIVAIVALGLLVIGYAMRRRRLLHL